MKPDHCERCLANRFEMSPAFSGWICLGCRLFHPGDVKGLEDELAKDFLKELEKL